MAEAYGLEWRAAGVDDPASLRSMLTSATLLLNAAGPFATTSAPLIDACIATGIDYLDITGEAGVIEATHGWHEAAARRGVMLMPGVGYEVVASDCLAAHVAGRLAGATRLRLGWDKSETTSRGSLKTVLELLGEGILVRRDGTLVSLAPGSLEFEFDF